MENLKGKKLMIIGGAFQHCKLVEAAKQLGVITYVTDYLTIEDAPAKQIADYYFMNNITDIDGIVDICKKEKIDGIISTSLDACQIPYFKVCQALGKPCFGTEEQFHILTDKRKFKEACIENGVDVIPEYKEEDFISEENCTANVQFPVLVKPCISRGSRGQSICNSFVEIKKAIVIAKSESSNGKIVIEKYMGQANDFSMTVLVINSKAYVIRTVDRILGKYEDGLDKLAVGSASPSVFTKLYLEKAHGKIENFIKSIGLVNAPMFMQGFVDGDCVRFYDPGLRFPGGEHERMFKHVFGKDVLYPFIEFALTGRISEDSISLSENDVFLKGKVAAQILPTLRAGKITEIEGLEEIRKLPNVVSVFERFKLNDEIKATHNVNQRFGEIDIVCDSNRQVVEVSKQIFALLNIKDENGLNMIVSDFNPQCYLDRENYSC